MDINVNINGIKEPLSQAEARRVQNAVKSTIVKEIRNSKDEKSKTVRKPQTFQEVPSFLQAFLTTTHGIITFFIMVFVIAIPASAIGGAMYVASQDTAPITASATRQMFLVVTHITIQLPLIQTSSKMLGDLDYPFLTSRMTFLR